MVIIANMKTTTVARVLPILVFLQVICGVSVVDDRCVFDFERASSDRPYAFSHLAEETPIPEGKDYHVRIYVKKTNDVNRTCSVGLKLPDMEDEEGFLTLHPGKKCQYPMRDDKVHQIQYTYYDCIKSRVICLECALLFL